MQYTTVSIDKKIRPTLLRKAKSAGCKSIPEWLRRIANQPDSSANITSAVVNGKPLLTEDNRSSVSSESVHDGSKSVEPKKAEEQ